MQFWMKHVARVLAMGMATAVASLFIVGATWAVTPPSDPGSSLADKPNARWMQTRAEVTAADAHTPGEEAMFGGIQFVWIPPGTFMMGSLESEQDRISNKGHLNRLSNEAPRHRVTLTHELWIGKYEVTQSQWEAVMGSNPSCFIGDASLPVEQVSWNDVTGPNGFLDTLNHANPGTTFRLPTEAEWEYACRAGTTTRFYWGDDPSYSEIGAYAWYNGNSGGTTHPVGQKTPNAWGIYDMSGNVWEWCQDWYKVYSARPVLDPWKSSVSADRVPRGGSWVNNGRYCRSADRYGDHPDNRNYGIGVRLCISGSAR